VENRDRPSYQQTAEMFYRVFDEGRPRIVEEWVLPNHPAGETLKEKAIGYAHAWRKQEDRGD
jgi:hypothetical protein